MHMIKTPEQKLTIRARAIAQHLAALGIEIDGMVQEVGVKPAVQIRGIQMNHKQLDWWTQDLIAVLLAHIRKQAKQARNEPNGAS